jgi:transposase-like protein
MIDELSQGPCCWPAKLRCDLVLSILRGDSTIEMVAERHRIDVDELHGWIRRFLAGAEAALQPARDDRDVAPEDPQGSQRLVEELRNDLGELRRTTIDRVSLSAWDD